MIVADVNLIAYLLITGPHTKGAEKVFQRDRRWIAPRFHRFELLNVLSKSVRRNEISRDQALAVWHRAQRIVPGFSVEPNPVDVLEASIQSRLTTYDCEYVLLARMRKLKLVTADKEILIAAPDVAISIEDFAGGN